MGALPALVSVDEYLHTVYRPDCDYVDGRILERNAGEKTHAKAQRRLLLYPEAHRTLWNILVFQELRVQVPPTRFRVPDTCVVLGPEPEEEIFTTPPFLCIEVLSPEDRMSRMQEKIDDYLRFGVRYLWLIDPYVHRAWIYTRDGMREAADGVLRTQDRDIAVPIAEIIDA